MWGRYLCIHASDDVKFCWSDGSSGQWFGMYSSSIFIWCIECWTTETTESSGRFICEP